MRGCADAGTGGAALPLPLTIREREIVTMAGQGVG
jgi:hypothetical protein